MLETQWTVTFIGQAKKADKALSHKAFSSFRQLIKELIVKGPYRSDWPNYTKMSGKDDYHCLILKGRPTYVVCWVIANKKDKIIEVYYAGTHEKAPY